jgi:hypothetical protein
MGGRRFGRVLVVGVALCSLAGVDAPGVSVAAILKRLDDGAKHTVVGIGLPLVAAGRGLLLWFAVWLRRVLDRLSGGEPLAHSIVPAAGLLSGLLISWGVARRVERNHGHRDDADRAAGARSADVGRPGVLRHRRAVSVRLLERGMASVAFVLWLIGAVIGRLRAARRPAPEPTVPAQCAPSPEAARTPPDLH